MTEFENLPPQRPSRISFRVEPTFYILCGLFVVLDLEEQVPMAEALLWLPILFLSVLVHELGHAASFLAFGLGGSEITLGGMGGHTLNRAPRKAWQDLFVALAGPACSFLLSFAFAWSLRRFPAIQDNRLLFLFFLQMRQANFFWALFNLVPVYPLDGGQVIRNLARLVASERTAFVISTWSSIVLGGAVVIGALLTRYVWLAVIASFLVVQNAQAWGARRNTPW